MAGGEPSAYDQGAEMGRINAVLLQHGDHLAKINGSQAENVKIQGQIKNELHEMRLEMAAIRQQAAADADTRVALAAALKEAEVARREKEKDTADALRVKSDETWQPYARALVVLTALVAIGGLALAVLR